jgi:hypothetical protein
MNERITKAMTLGFRYPCLGIDKTFVVFAKNVTIRRVSVDLFSNLNFERI